MPNDLALLNGYKREELIAQLVWRKVLRVEHTYDSANGKLPRRMHRYVTEWEYGLEPYEGPTDVGPTDPASWLRSIDRGIITLLQGPGRD